MTRLALGCLVLAGCIEPVPVLFSHDSGEDGGADAGLDAGQPFVADQIAAAETHACAVHAGALFCWGNNADGQLGLGDVQPRSAPVRVGSDSDWAEVRVGYESTCARKTSGSVWCWGDNTHGQLGRGVAGGLRAPAQVTLSFAAQQLALHFEHACALAQSGDLWCWGANTEGQLGLNESFYPTSDQLSPQHVAPGTLWKQVDTGQGHSCALQQNGTLWCWGRNSQGQLGLDAGASIQIHDPTQVGVASDWVHVTATQDASCALDTGGALWCWGYAYDAPIDSYTIQYGPRQLTGDSGWQELEIETFSICARDAAGALWCWGRNDEGELGTGDNTSRYAPFEADTAQWLAGAMGRMFRCAIRQGGGLYCTGENADGQLGLGDTQRRNVMTQVRLP